MCIRDRQELADVLVVPCDQQPRAVGKARAGTDEIELLFPSADFRQRTVETQPFLALPQALRPARQVARDLLPLGVDQQVEQARKARGLDAIGNDQGYTCLLYTSPSPRDRTRSRMPSSA